jgi:hypothetical protein
VHGVGAEYTELSRSMCHLVQPRDVRRDGGLALKRREGGASTSGLHARCKRSVPNGLLKGDGGGGFLEGSTGVFMLHVLSS